MRRVVEPLLSGGEARHEIRDLEYVRDLGLIDGNQPPRIANPIYAEVVPRELGYILQSSLDQNPAWYVDDDGGLNMDKLLTAFGTFFGEHSEHWLGRFGDYPEAGPQLILQAYLQRVVNGGGRIEREYGLGRGRTDLLVLWPRERAAVGPVGAFRGRVQGAAGLGPQEPGMDGRAGHGADVGLHGEVQGGGGASGGDRPP